MSVLLYYLILHLCVSMHACNSRHLGVFSNEPGQEFRLFSKNPEIMAEIEGRKVDENNMEPKEFKFEFLSDQQKKIHKGSDIKVKISQEETKMEGWKNRARSTMEYSKQQDSKETISDSKGNGVTEDVVAMDYAQPHRKPPIHNLKP